MKHGCTNSLQSHNKRAIGHLCNGKTKPIFLLEKSLPLYCGNHKEFFDMIISQNRKLLQPKYILKEKIEPKINFIEGDQPRIPFHFLQNKCSSITLSLALMMKTLQKLKWDFLRHPQCTDLAPSNIHLLGPLKEFCRREEI